jgi:hypothetical protein
MRNEHRADLVGHQASAQASTQRLALFAAATAIATATLIPVYRLQNLEWPAATAAAAVFVVPCAVLGLITWRLAINARPPRTLARAIALHAAGALAFSAVWTLVFAAFVYVMRPEWIPGFLGDGAVWQFTWGLVIYLAIVQAAHLRARLREREMATAAAELQALRAQLNPHFLFNTLHSLAQLAREDAVATQDALEKFGELMRYVLDAGRRPASGIALEEEMSFIRRYLALESLRLGERLRVMEEIHPDALDFEVPPLLLQPLVENAVRHGIAPRRKGGTVRITAQLSGSSLRIGVADDGEGSSPDAWRRSTGMGLKSVSRQLQACFGSAAELEVVTQPNAGFSATIRIPARMPGSARQ